MPVPGSQVHRGRMRGHSHSELEVPITRETIALRRREQCPPLQTLLVMLFSCTQDLYVTSKRLRQKYEIQQGLPVLE